jgi:hypothetical protein
MPQDMTSYRHSERVRRELAVLCADYEKVEGMPFEHFFCPILLKDEPARLCMGHIVNDAIPNSYGGTVIQRQDVDGFFGRHFEADYTTRMQAHSLTPEEAIAHPILSKKIPAKLKINGEEWPHYPDRGHAPPNHSRVMLNFGSKASLKWVVKKSPEEIAALGDTGTFEMAIGTDYRLPFLVSLIKSAYLTLFKLTGYSYSLGVGGQHIGHGLLGAVFSELNGLETDEVRKRSIDHFRPYVNIVRPIERFTGKTPLGTIEDHFARVCCTPKGSFFAIIVDVRAGESHFAVMLPVFDDADGVSAYFTFINSERTQLFTHNCQIDPDKVLVSQQLKEVNWPKGDHAISLD